MIQALLAAALFGVSAPASKVLLGDVEPIPLAALLYLGSGLSLWWLQIARRLSKRSPVMEARLERADAGWLIGAILAGGVAAPIVLLFSLRHTPAATASLLLNFEGAATTSIAALIFKEAIGRRAWWAMGCVLAASALLSLNFNGEWGVSVGALGVLAACGLWGIDNNLTRHIAAKDPLAIVTWKGLGAAACSIGLSLVLGLRWPTVDVALKAMLLGSLSYGLSIVLFIRALRGLGAARTSALYGTAPLAGVIAAMVMLGEAPSVWLAVALPLMVGGTWLLLNEHHVHPHTHVLVAHDHAHRHDEAHHRHAHAVTESADQHAHRHEHPRLEHDHDHLPDLHHRHRHAADE